MSTQRAYALTSATDSTSSGSALDPEANAALNGEGAIEAATSTARIQVVHAREDVIAARAVRALVS